jgi:2-polyprenyl-3-methyl-5-hydroxy-6-metoxy-1,4-benzoquinol methylase
MPLQDKIAYWARSAAAYRTHRACPGCGGENLQLVERKYLFTRLFLCRDCRLMFRHPTDDADASRRFYQSDYAQDDGITTELPDPKQLQAMIADGFGEKNADHYRKAIGILLPEMPLTSVRMIDYGCSWGYQSYQFRQSGIDCRSYEISAPRAADGNRHLGLDIKTDESMLEGGNDVFYSSHVIEHLPSPKRMIDLGMSLLREGGYFIIESPNGSEAFRRAHPAHFSKLWGMVHPNMISVDFYEHAFASSPFLITSTPFDNLLGELNRWDKKSTRILDLTGPTLLLIARKL